MRGPRGRMDIPAVGATLPCRRRKIKPGGRSARPPSAARPLRAQKPAWPRPSWATRRSRFRVVDTAQGAPHNPALLTGTRVRRDATFDDGGVSRVAKGADCKSAGLRLRRFESYLPHQPQISLKISLLACSEKSATNRFRPTLCASCPHYVRKITPRSGRTGSAVPRTSSADIRSA